MEWYEYPWRLEQNKIVRYPGGREIDRFRGVELPMDDGRPEAWVGSDTPTVDAAEKGNIHDGCARCVLPDGERCYLFEAVERAPLEVLGPGHVARYGSRLGVLVKLLDAQRQLGLQTHPTRDYAKTWFDSEFGKEESWYIIGKRTDCPEPPYVLMGFREGVTREEFERGFDQGDIRAMEACCHKIPVEIGDAFFIEAGLPHAIGGGCFVVEVQEPSDITVGAHPLSSGTREERARHKERLLGCYHYQGADYEENLRQYRIPPRLLRQGDWGKEELIIGPEQTPYFSFSRLDATGPVDLLSPGTLQIAIVLSGTGVLECGEAKLSLAQGDELFLPQSVAQSRLVSTDSLSLVLCKPTGILPKL